MTRDCGRARRNGKIENAANEKQQTRGDGALYSSPSFLRDVVAVFPFIPLLQLREDF